MQPFKMIFLRNISNKIDSKFLIRNHGEGFPHGTVVKNPPVNAGDTGSSPGPGRSHMPRSNKAHAPYY